MKTAIQNHLSNIHNSPIHQVPENEALSRIKTKYQTLVNNLSVGIYQSTPGPTGHFIEANPAIIAMFEAGSEKEFLKHSVSDFYRDPEKREMFSEKLLKDGYVRNEQLELVTLKGRALVASVTAVMQKDTEGNLYFDGIVEDITAHKKMENELKKDQEELEKRVQERTKKLEDIKKAMVNVWDDLNNEKTKLLEAKVKDDAILESIGDGIIATDRKGNITIMNQVAEKLLGWTLKEAIGKPLVDLTPMEDEKGHSIRINDRPITQAIAYGKKTCAKYYYTKKNKKKIPVAVTVTPIILNKEIVGVIEIYRDITKEQEVDRAKSEFVSLASHQLRTPLGVAKWYLEAIRGANYFNNVPEIAKEYLDQVYSSNERLLALVRDFLSISRIDQGEVRDAPTLTDVADLIKKIVKEMKIAAIQKNIEIHIEMKQLQNPVILIDSLRLQEVVENLLSNAIKYSHPRGKINVMVDEKAEKLILCVKDTGIGISEEDQKHLFTKFFRSEKAFMTSAEGSGLGLYVVKAYVEEWGGHIFVESVEGQGATFSIMIPVKKGGDRT